MTRVEIAASSIVSIVESFACSSDAAHPHSSWEISEKCSGARSTDAQDAAPTENPRGLRR